MPIFMRSGSIGSDGSNAKLLPVTNGLYTVVETYFPDDVKYKIRGAITDDLGQRSVFLLLLTATVELALDSLFKGVRWIVARVLAKRSAGAEVARSSV